jgi:hypothetical protein
MKRIGINNLFLIVPQKLDPKQIKNLKKIGIHVLDRNILKAIVKYHEPISNYLMDFE